MSTKPERKVWDSRHEPKRLLTNVLCGAAMIVVSAHPLLAAAAPVPRKLFTEGGEIDQAALARAHLPPIQEVRRVIVNPAFLKAVHKRAPLVLPIEGMEGVLLKPVTGLNRLPDKDNSGRSIWGGANLKTGASATLQVKNGKVSGSASSPRGLFRIVPLDNGTHAVVKVDVSKLPRGEPGGLQFKLQQQGAQDIDRWSRLTKREQPSGVAQIEVLVAYTLSAEAAAGDMDGLIRQAIAETNQAYANGGIRVNLHLADSLRVEYDETDKPFDDMLTDFMAMDEVKKRREQKNADIAVMLFNTDVLDESCGLAKAIPADADSAFAVLHQGCAVGVYMVAHEVGHLMGARHEEDEDSSGPPYAHGYRHLPTIEEAGWQTVMVRQCPPPCTRLQFFSSPEIQADGTALGTAERNDNARVLGETAAGIAAFRPLSPTTTVARRVVRPIVRPTR